MEYVLQTTNLTKKIGEKTIVQDVNMHIQKGQIYGFLGPNGAGKTTIMKMITNLWKPTAGGVILFGKQQTEGSYEELKRIGSVIEFPAFYERMTAEQNLKLHCEYMGYYQKDAVPQALHMLGLEADAKTKVSAFSLGMKQRLGLARAIITRPDFLILDEPINGLDPEGIRQIRDLLHMLAVERKTTILISSHILSEVASIATTIGVISNGTLKKEISMKEIEDKNVAYIEVVTPEIQKGAYVLTEQLGIQNFKIVEEHKIRIYDTQLFTGTLSSTFAANGVTVEALVTQSESLEDYYLKMTKGER